MKNTPSQSEFLILLAQLILDNKYKSFIVWNAHRKTIIIKNKHIFTLKIMYHKLSINNFSSFVFQMKINGFNIRAIDNNSMSVMFDCVDQSKFNHVLQLIDITHQIDNQFYITHNTLQNLKNNLHSYPQDLIESLFTIKSTNRRLNQLSIKALLVSQVNPNESLQGNLQEIEDDTPILSTKTMQIIALQHDY